MYFDVPRKRLSKIIIPAHEKALSQNCMYFTLLADNSCKWPQTLNMWEKQMSGDRPVYTPKAHVCIFTVLTFPLWVSFQYHLLVYFDLITINTLI